MSGENHEMTAEADEASVHGSVRSHATSKHSASASASLRSEHVLSVKGDGPGSVGGGETAKWRRMTEQEQLDNYPFAV